ncbi:IS701 family transposase [Haloactinomyces albus]|uniref:SRSO17 transposase n=1 Tax=Haloactinomyces albus TaxID=1352928 RepID=A0AAE4CQY0_9ACTN|nr:IS701 family transposase [Haloactinomyces albus]MDR7304572.1 SRSO17 transposase [Haloactinomyces albus]
MFGRVEMRSAARAFVSGLLAPIERKTCWQLAEHAGHARPERMQRLLHTACWDADAVHDEVYAFIGQRFADPAGVSVVDETGFLTKGACSAGVQRQYSGTAGRIENCQVGLFATYAGESGHAVVDRELYLPEQTWCADVSRCQRAGIPFAWVAADEVYGQSSYFRSWPESHGIGYVLAVACDHRLTVSRDGTKRALADIAAELPTSAWHPHSAGAGAKGPRDYDCAWISLPGQHRQSVLIRRNRTSGEHAYYRCYAPQPVPLAELVRIAGMRWHIEDSFQNAKSLLALATTSSNPSPPRLLPATTSRVIAGVLGRSSGRWGFASPRASSSEVVGRG